MATDAASPPARGAPTTPAAHSTANSASATRLSEDVRRLVLSAEREDRQRHCLVCYSDLDYAAIAPCHHNEICPACLLRLRFLHRDRRCPICKAEHDQVIVDRSAAAEDSDSGAAPARQFQDYPLWGNDLGAGFLYRDDVGMFFPVDFFEREIRPLFNYPCGVAGCGFEGTAAVQGVPPEEARPRGGRGGRGGRGRGNGGAAADAAAPATTPLRALQDHLRAQHRRTLCGLCTEHPRDFVARLPRFSPTQLKEHLERGDGPASGFSGHPLCEFCRPKRFYDLTELHRHLTKEHYKCHVCERLGLDNQFFRDYAALEKHFDAQHFLCRDPQCLAARFGVFANEIDYAAHRRQVHGASANDTKIQLQFRVRRSTAAAPDNQHVPDENDFNYGLDGEAFVPAALPESNEELALHPRHVQRTEELRAMAAAMRDSLQETPGVEAFPTLQEAVAESAEDDAGAAQQPPLRMGWTDGASLRRVGRASATGVVTDEEYPSLPPAPKPSRATARLHAGGNRTFAAMNAVASQGWRGAAASSEMASATPSAAVNSFLVPAAASRGPRNDASSLTADNFPSLGPSTSQARPNYAAANALAKRIAAKPPSLTSGAFPSLGSASRPAYGAHPTSSRTTARQAPPSMTSATDFPAPPTSHVRAGDRSLAVAAPSASAVATVADMKAALGPAKYKLLKGCTREFAAGDLDPEAFVDHAASLFDQGYADDRFWAFLPGLVASCPDHYTSAQALRYLDHLQKMRNGALNAEAAQVAAAAAAAGVGPAAMSRTSAAPMAASLAARYAPAAPPPPPPVPRNPGGPAHPSAWSAGGSAPRSGPAPPSPALGRIVAPSGSAGAAPGRGAATAGAPGGGGKASNNKKKKKQNAELQKLAFG